jgi:hypothetical protein
MLSETNKLTSALLFCMLLVIIPFSIIIFFLIKGLLNSKDKHIYVRRLSGDILVPHKNKGEYRRIVFKDAEVGKTVITSSSGSSSYIVIDNYPIEKLAIDANTNWAFYVWYMDKNRPLPPGSVFDEFRQTDFERRKAEGFPAPLFKSTIPTPEATHEQQAERELHWKDNDHYGVPQKIKLTDEEKQVRRKISKKRWGIFFIILSSLILISSVYSAFDCIIEEYFEYGINKYSWSVFWFFISWLFLKGRKTKKHILCNLLGFHIGHLLLSSTTNKF